MQTDPAKDNPIKSRTQAKLDSLELTTFGKQLIDLSELKLSLVPLNEDILNQIRKAKTMQKIALKRQIQYIGKLLRSQSEDEIKEAKEVYQNFTSKNAKATALLHRIENIRLKLLDPDKSKETLTKLLNDNPQADSQIIRQLIRNTHKEMVKNSTSKSFKELFKYLNSVI